MRIVGLTGGIASGKSTVANFLREKGARVLDADLLAKEAVLPGRPAYNDLVEWLGNDYLLADGSLDRAKLGDLVFNDSAARAKLNEIVHPRVGQAFLALSREIATADPDAILVYDVPLLIEAGISSLVDVILLVYVRLEVQLQRLQARDGLNRREAMARINAQMPLEEKKKYAHVIIDNNGSIEDTTRQVDSFFDHLYNS